MLSEIHAGILPAEMPGLAYQSSLPVNPQQVKPVLIHPNGTQGYKAWNHLRFSIA